MTGVGSMPYHDEYGNRNNCWGTGEGKSEDEDNQELSPWSMQRQVQQIGMVDVPRMPTTLKFPDGPTLGRQHSLVLVFLALN